MPSAINILWTILLVVTVLLLPYIIFLLHSTWNAAKSIERYFAEMRDAGLGIAKNVEHVKDLNDTISVASAMLGVAADINKHAETIKDTLGSRTKKPN